MLHQVDQYRFCSTMNSRRQWTNEKCFKGELLLYQKLLLRKIKTQSYHIWAIDIPCTVAFTQMWYWDNRLQVLNMN